MNNRYPGRCFACGTLVEVEAGTAQTGEDGKWHTFCAMADCQKKAALQRSPRLKADGRLFAPYEMRAACMSLPGASWDKRERVWKVSMAPEDRMALLLACKRHGIQVPDELQALPEAEKTVEH